VRAALRALEVQCDVELVETVRHQHGIELADEAVALGFDAVGSMGGDGTANEVLNGTGDRLPIGEARRHPAALAQPVRRRGRERQRQSRLRRAR